MLKKHTVAAVLATSISSPLTQAQDLSYSFFELGHSSFEEAELSVDGFYLKGSFDIAENIFIFAESKQGDTEIEIVGFGDVEFDFDRSGFGLGIKSAPGESHSWFASYAINTWDIGGEDLDVNVLRVGFRGTWTENLEVNASLTNNEFDDGEGSSSEKGYQLGFQYYVTDTTALIGNYETIDEIDETSFAIRFNF